MYCWLECGNVLLVGLRQFSKDRECLRTKIRDWRSLVVDLDPDNSTKGGLEIFLFCRALQWGPDWSATSRVAGAPLIAKVWVPYGLQATKATPNAMSVTMRPLSAAMRLMYALHCLLPLRDADHSASIVLELRRIRS
jgi:hypothetical protein